MISSTQLTKFIVWVSVFTVDSLNILTFGLISSPYTVVLGSDALSGDEPTKQEFRSTRFIPHPDYDGHMNDIMLIQVLNSFFIITINHNR